MNPLPAEFCNNAEANIHNWGTLTQAEREGFAVFFYNVGEDKANLYKANGIAVCGFYDVDIARVLIAQEYLRNRAAMADVMHNGTAADELRDKVADDYFAQHQCFLAETPILMADGTERRIDTIRPGDMVTSYDAEGRLVPGRVARIFQKDAKHILDLFGLMVTPGHVMLCGEGRFAGRHVPLLDILRSDGALVEASGRLIRAATGVEVGSELDAEIIVVAGHPSPGGFVVQETGRMRLGSRVILETCTDLSVADLVAANGGQRTATGLIASAAGEGPLLWPFGSRLPRPEDYVLARSAVTLDEIHAAAEWEVAPIMPAPPHGARSPSEGLRLREPLQPNQPLSMRAAARGTGQ